MARLLPLLGTVLLLLLATAAVQFALGQMAQRPLSEVGIAAAQTAAPPDTPGVTVSAAPTVATLRPAVYYAAITDRPLFAPDRRPAIAAALPAGTATESPVTPAPEPAADTAPPRLLGTMAIGKGGSALLALDDQPPGWTPMGAAYLGWTLTALGPDWAEITLNTRTLRLDLYPQ